MKVYRNDMTIRIVESNYLDSIVVSDGKNTFPEFIPRVLTEKLEQFFEGWKDEVE